jgi:uncharacterized membrane protein YhaH (DUF805 family)
LFLLADVVALLPMGAEEGSALATVLIVISCLVPIRFWPRRVLERWLGPLALSILAIWVLTKVNVVYGEVSSWSLIAAWFIYGLGPIVIWLALVSGRFRDQRESIRRGLIAFYFPVAVGNIWFYQVAWREGVAGFVPCSLGLFLMALGYTRLAQEDGQAGIAPPQSGAATP